MAHKRSFRTRLRYRFDNTMSRGTVSLVGWLAVVSLIMLVAVSAALELVSPSGVGLFDLLWQTFVKTFALDVPDDPTTPLDVVALWFVLALGGIFVVSALVGLLTSGLSGKMDQLRKGRS